MIIDDQHYDVIVIGSGAAGASLLMPLAAAGRRVLLLERGGEMAPADPEAADVELFRKSRYHAEQPWFGPDGDPFAPQTIYALGGNSKIWGGVLERMREREFGGVALQEGPVPGWGIGYDELAPYYERAEALYRVHGSAGVDPTEPPRRADFPHHPRPIEPFLEELRGALQRQGAHPYDLPLSWAESPHSSSGDAQCFAVEPARRAPSVTVREGCQVRRLHVNPGGTEVRGVEAQIGGQLWLFAADQVVLAAGAIHTAEILLRSASEQHPGGLANGSDQVGRNLMKPQLTAILQRSAAPHSGRFAPSLGITDYYWGDKNVSFPLGSIQSGGGVLQDALFAESPPVLSLITRLLPRAGLRNLASRTITWWAMSAVRPDPQNRVTLRGDSLQIQYVPNNREAHDRLVYRWLDTIGKVESDPLCSAVTPFPIHPRGESPLPAMGSVCGTCRMGREPAGSVVDLHGRSHQLANLWIADASVFPSCPAVGFGLTVIANALRIGDALEEVL
jgi:hypothetical protein